MCQNQKSALSHRNLANNLNLDLGASFPAHPRAERSAFFCTFTVRGYAVNVVGCRAGQAIDQDRRTPATGTRGGILNGNVEGPA